MFLRVLFKKNFMRKCCFCQRKAIVRLTKDKKNSLKTELCVLQWGWPDNYSQVHWSTLSSPLLSCRLSLSSTNSLFFINITLHSHLQTSFHADPNLSESWRAAQWNPFCWVCLGGSPWSPRESSPRLTDAWPLWTWWPSVWAALLGLGSTFCLERWPETLQDQASSSLSSSPPWHPYLPGCAMQSSGPGFPKQAQHTFTAMWLLESCWLSLPGGICYSPMS